MIFLTLPFRFFTSNHNSVQADVNIIFTVRVEISRNLLSLAEILSKWRAIKKRNSYN